MKHALRRASRRLHPMAWLALCAVLAAPPAFAQWKWRDKSGQVHVSDLPPPAGVSDDSILQRPSAARPIAPSAAAPAASAASSAVPAAAASTPSKLEAEAQARKRKTEDEEKAKQKAADEKNAAARAENCTNAKRHLASLQSGVRLARMNDKGEREYLDDKTRAEETQAAQRVVSNDCK
jgi:hypothetical protein